MQAWTYKPQNRQDGSAFALTYILRLRSCPSMDAFVISPLPAPMSETLQMAGPLGSTDIARLHRHYGPVRHPLAFGRFPGVAGHTAYLAPAISRRDERASPVAQHVLVTVLSRPPRQGEQPCRSVFGCPGCLGPLVAGSALGKYRFSRPQRVHCCYGPLTRDLPWEGLVDRLRRFRFHRLRHPNYGALTSTPAGLSPAEHASPHRTHNHTVRLPRRRKLAS